MSHKLINANGHLSLDIYYEVEDVPDQEHWNGKDKWRPTSVHLQLSTAKRFRLIPKPLDITTLEILGESLPVNGITVHGVKIKRKDGLPGKVPTTEHYYSQAMLPEWLRDIVSETLLEMA
jgi:hypothetical protein